VYYVRDILIVTVVDVYMAKDRILGYPKNVFTLGLTSLFNDFSSEMIHSILPAFFVSVLGVGAGALGVVEGVADAAANVMKIYSGQASDRTRKHKVFAVAGYSLSVLTRPFYVLAVSIGSVAGLRFIDRLGKGLRETPRDVLISLSTSPQEAGRSFGFHKAMDTTGAVIGPLVAFWILAVFPGSFSTVFAVSFIVGIVAVGTLFFVREIKRADPPTVPVGVRIPTKPLSKHYKLFLVSIFLLSMGSLPVAVLLLKTTDSGLALALIPLFYVTYNISYVGFSIGAGKVADRIGAEKVIVAGYLILVVAYLLFGIASSTIVLVISFLVLGLFSALTVGVERAYAARHTDESHRGAAFGYFYVAVGLGALCAGTGGGYIWQVYGPLYALFAGALVVLSGLVVFTVGNGYLDRKRVMQKVFDLPQPPRFG
jgi:MFS family permease